MSKNLYTVWGEFGCVLVRAHPHGGFLVINANEYELDWAETLPVAIAMAGQYADSDLCEPSAAASAGYGTDECYGYYGGDDW